MALLIYLLAYPILWLISKLPFRLLYILSDGTYILLYHIIRYRRKTVRSNLNQALNSYDKKKLLKIEKNFYRHLCDVFLEMIKTISITEKQLNRRFQFTNIDLVHSLENNNKSILLFCSHYANWEWTIIMGKHINFKGYALYKRIKNRYFDSMMHQIRSRFDATLIDSKYAIRRINENEKNNRRGIYAFISDQAPPPSRTYYWESFLGKKAPVHTSAESLAKKFDFIPLYLNIEKNKRGYYQATFVELLDNHQQIKDIKDFDLTKNFLKKLEEQIYKAPEYYFWTHKRWKYSHKTSMHEKKRKKIGF